MYGSARSSYIKRLDTVHNHGFTIMFRSFSHTSPEHSLYVEANEPPLDMRRDTFVPCNTMLNLCIIR